MPFYVIRYESTGEYLSMQGNSWVNDMRDAAVFTSRRTATSSIRRAWVGLCAIERIDRLPDRIRLPRAASAGSADAAA
jgi:hypothetical protein